MSCFVVPGRREWGRFFFLFYFSWLRYHQCWRELSSGRKPLSMQWRLTNTEERLVLQACSICLEASEGYWLYKQTETAPFLDFIYFSTVIHSILQHSASYQLCFPFSQFPFFCSTISVWFPPPFVNSINLSPALTRFNALSTFQKCTLSLTPLASPASFFPSFKQQALCPHQTRHQCHLP